MYILYYILYIILNNISFVNIYCMCLYLYIHNKYTQYTHICIHKFMQLRFSVSRWQVVVDKHVVIRKPGPHLSDLL